MHHVFTDMLVAHVDFELHKGVVDGHVLGHQVDNFAGPFDFGEGVHLNEVQIGHLETRCESGLPIAKAIRFTLMYWPSYRIEPLMSMITTVAHFRVVSSAMYFDVFRFQSQRQSRSVAKHCVHKRLGNIHLRD